MCSTAMAASLVDLNQVIRYALTPDLPYPAHKILIRIFLGPGPSVARGADGGPRPS